MIDAWIATAIGPHIEMILATAIGLMLATLFALLGEWRNMDKREEMMRKKRMCR